MDSMRSLNTSLPSTRPAPPEALLQAFRTAALSVTNLYKSAVTDQNASRQLGYQEALADILNFLDRENLGLQDGEGWRVRQWATERYDGSVLPQQGESEDERSESGQRPRSMTPTREQQVVAASENAEPEQPEPAADADDNSASVTQDHAPTAPIFHFTGNNTTQTSDDMQTDEDGTQPAESDGPSASNSTCRPTVIARGSRTPNRHSGQRHSAKSATREFTFSAGTKRKFPIPDFFDISNIGSKDGSGANKRGRIS
jgi:hypothetical protein